MEIANVDKGINAFELLDELRRSRKYGRKILKRICFIKKPLNLVYSIFLYKKKAARICNAILHIKNVWGLIVL